MKIWMINHYAASAAQAGGTRHVSLAAELVRRGHSVRLFASSFSHSSGTSRSVGSHGQVHWEQAAGIEIGWVPTPAYSDNSFGRAWNMIVFALRILQLRRHCSARPHVIYGSTPSLFAALAGLAVARGLGVRFVLEVRDIWPQTLIDLGMSRFHPFVVLSAVIERYLYQRADVIVTLMPNAAPHLVARGAARERIHWIANGVNFDLVPPVSPPEQKDKLDVMYAGAYGAGNNPETILDAAAKLRQRGGPVMRFRFIGSGSGEAALIAKRTALGLDNVSLEPLVPKSRVYSVLSEADILVAPVRPLAVHRFGVCGNKVFDYMAAARPIIHAVRSSNHPVLDAGCGLECPPDDPEALAEAISTLASMSAQDRWEMGLRGRRYVEQNHDFARLAVKLESILASALDEPLARSTGAARLQHLESAKPVQPNN
jgi:glycosyltransferase involved in cell wall biosynthesis